MSDTNNAAAAIPALIAAAITAGAKEVPFGRWLGLKVGPVEGDRVSMIFEMRDELIGNPEKKVLHGGIISTALDTAGGLAAYLGVLYRAAQRSEDPPSGYLSTIDMRTDYLQPGNGETFTATAFPLRVGRRSVVTRMELHNESGDLIAVGTGTYAVP